MEPEDILGIIRKALDSELGENFETTPTKYDAVELQYKPSIGVIEKFGDKWAVRFNINISDNKKKRL